MTHREPPFAPHWMRVAEAAAQLGVHPKTFHLWLRAGELPVRVLRIGTNGIVRVHREDFEAYVAKTAKVPVSA